jgi:hypothetical protein
MKMSDSYDLYDGTPPHQAAETSLEAAEEIKPHINQLQKRVLSAIRARGDSGMTDDELEVGLDLIGSTVRPRRRELELKGLIETHGNKRKTRTGRNALVWVCTSSSSPYRVICFRCGPELLTEQQYTAQMMRPDDLWICPTCGSFATWDDDWYERFM